MRGRGFASAIGGGAKSQDGFRLSPGQRGGGGECGLLRPRYGVVRSPVLKSRYPGEGRGPSMTLSPHSAGGNIAGPRVEPEDDEGRDGFSPSVRHGRARPGHPAERPARAEGASGSPGRAAGMTRGEIGVRGRLDWAVAGRGRTARGLRSIAKEGWTAIALHKKESAREGRFRWGACDGDQSVRSTFSTR